MWLIRPMVGITWLAVAGCAATPDPISDTGDGPPLGVVRDTPERFIGERVRWGGTIASVENDAEETRVYVVARGLGSNGRPKNTDISAGRFVALLSGFHDPVVLEQGRELTAVGVLEDATRATIGDFEYLYPVVRAESHRLWPKREPRYYYRGPAYYPYYRHGPWYPYHHWPHHFY